MASRRVAKKIQLEGRYVWGGTMLEDVPPRIPYHGRSYNWLLLNVSGGWSRYIRRRSSWRFCDLAIISEPWIVSK
jgi:hypothetical protein